MTGLGALLGFLNPWFLAALPFAIGGLLYIYRRRGHGKEFLFPTFLLIREFQSTPARPKKIIPPWRFFFELLVLLLLVGSAAGFFLKSRGERVLFLIDNSLSMAARGVGPRGAETFLEQALVRARQELEELSANSEVQIAVSSPQVRNLSEDFESKDAALERLDDLMPVFARDQLDQAIRQVRAQSMSQRLVVFTDKGALPDPAHKHPGIDIVRVGFARGDLLNASLRRLELSRDGSKVSLLASVALFVAPGKALKGKQQARIRVFGVTESGRGANALVQRDITLSAVNETEVEFKDLTAAVIGYAVSIELLNPTSGTYADSLTEDDWAWVAIDAKSEGGKIISDFSIEQLGISRLPLFSFEQLTPAQYEAQLQAKGQQSAEARLLIFHRAVPAMFPKTNALFVLPPSGNMFSLAPAVNDAQISNWLDAHPLTRYINVPLLNFPRLEPITVPAWGRALLTTTKGVAAMIGERDGAKLVVLGFDIFPYEGKKQPALSVLTINILKWLSGERITSSGTTTYAALGSQISNLEYLDSIFNKEDIADGQAGSASMPGLLRYEENGTSEITAINFLDGSESEVTREQLIDLPNEEFRAAPPSPPWVLSPSFARIALGLLLLDFALLVFLRHLSRRQYARV